MRGALRMAGRPAGSSKGRVPSVVCTIADPRLDRAVGLDANRSAADEDGLGRAFRNDGAVDQLDRRGAGLQRDLLDMDGRGGGDGGNGKTKDERDAGVNVQRGLPILDGEFSHAPLPL